MIKRTLKTTRGKLAISIPESLNEITLGQLMQLQEKTNLNDLEAISILSDIPLEQLQNVIDIYELQVFAEPVLSLSHQIKYLYNSDDIPKTVTFASGGETKTINVISNLSVEPAGAFMAARDIIADEINEHIAVYGEESWKDNFNPSLKACCQVLAHYFYCRATAKAYNEYDAEEFCSEIKKLRVTEALPVAKHFFTCYPGLSKRKISCLHRLQHYLKKGRAFNHSKSLNTSTL